MSWSDAGNRWATSGADTVIIWPFGQQDGPMGKEPGDARPAAGAGSPWSPAIRNRIFLAAGYSDGTILMVRFE